MKGKAIALCIVFAILIAVSGGSFIDAPATQRDSSVEERITRVENSLLPFISIKGQPSTMKLADRMAYYKVPGVSIAVIQGGAIEWARGYGVAEAGSDRAVNPGTLFQAASISKPVASMGALYLVEHGKLSLDEDVNLKLKSWKVPENDFTRQKKVTLRELLSHSAGLTVHGFGGYAAGEPVPTTVEILDGKKPANSAPVRVDILPGSKWRYSGGGITVMQLLVTDTTGEPFPKFMRDTVLSKIGMKDSTYQQPLPQEQWAKAATGHNDKGQAIKGKWHTYPEMAAAGLWTTPSDLARFAIELQKSLVGKSNKVLSADMTKQMLSKQFDDWGLGIQIKNNGTAFTHGGSNEGFKCGLFAYTATGQGAVIMTNGDNGSPLAEEILRGISLVYGWPDYKTKEVAVAAVEPKVYAAYAGEYVFEGIKLAVSNHGGRLFIQSPVLGPEKIELYPESETKYFITNQEVAFTFVKDDKGQVTELLIEPPGQKFHAKKAR